MDSSRHLPNGGRDDPQHALEVAHNLMVPEPQDPKPLPCQPTVSESISSALQMLTAIDFEDNSSIETDEIYDIGADWDLAPELAAQGLLTQVAPEKALGVGHFSSELTGVRGEDRWSHVR